MRYEQYSFCKSIAGHDKDTIYIIVKEEDKYVYVVDGKYKKLQTPKKKNKKHIEWISSIYNVPENDMQELRDENIRKAIKNIKGLN